ncbi:putative nuclease HARBI1 [Gigantopelta aegis]|uniref:putative nuclease HARBI1 n=1 Tax=Gigantopelta aegis TaxID=1735272 RepID=UPI001B88A0A1|nr:putative nuclease HARBI1 [Gigantopelta aegis]
MIGDDLVRPTQRSCPLTPELQLLITLRFLGKASFQSEIADLHGVVQSSVSNAVTATINALCRHLDFIKFPNDLTSKRKIKEGFYEIAGFPDVLGCIDGTLIPIMRPPTNEEVAYVCRKGYHAINIQGICDPDLRFINIVCK